MKVAVSGQVVFETWKERQAEFDVVLMDMQVIFHFSRVVLEIILC